MIAIREAAQEREARLEKEKMEFAQVRRGGVMVGER